MQRAGVKDSSAGPRLFTAYGPKGFTGSHFCIPAIFWLTLAQLDLSCWARFMALRYCVLSVFPEIAEVRSDHHDHRGTSTAWAEKGQGRGTHHHRRSENSLPQCISLLGSSTSCMYVLLYEYCQTGAKTLTIPSVTLYFDSLPAHQNFIPVDQSILVSAAVLLK